MDVDGWREMKWDENGVGRGEKVGSNMNECVCMHRQVRSFGGRALNKACPHLGLCYTVMDMYLSTYLLPGRAMYPHHYLVQCAVRYLSVAIPSRFIAV